MVIHIPDRGYLFLRNTLLLYSLSPYSQTESQTEKQIHLLRVGWRNFFSSCADVSVFWLWWKQFQVILTYHTSCAVVSFFLLRQEIVFGCTGQIFGCGRKQSQVLLPYLTYHTSCAIVSVFWLRRETVFGYSVSKKDSHSVSLIERQTASKCVYFIRSNNLLLCVSQLSIYLLYQKNWSFFISVL